MNTGLNEDRLVTVLTRAQTEGALGPRPIPEVIEHARDFITALPPDVSTVLDLGTGAGVPGLIIASGRPDLHLTLVDRRAKRIDALHRALVILGWTDRITLVNMDAETMARSTEWRNRFDAVVARGFAEPSTTLRIASQLARHNGWVVVSEPPEHAPSRWELAWCTEYQVSPPQRIGRVVRFHVEHGRNYGSRDLPDVPRGTHD